MSLFQTLSALLQPDPPLDQAVSQAIQHAVSVIDPGLQWVGNVEKRLAPAVTRALAYCESLAAQLPPPVEVNRLAFATDPLVHAFFASTEDIESMFAHSEAVHDFLADGANAFSTECFAMLGMRPNRKKVLGMALQGEVLQPDAPKEYLYFSDHTLRELTGSEAQTRAHLKIRAFDSLVISFADELKARRRARDELRTNLETERTSGRGGLLPDEKDWRISVLRTQYEEAMAALEPERVLEALEAHLNRAEQRLFLRDCRVTVDSLGVVAADGVEGPGYYPLNCPELISRDRRRWVVTLVRISCPEARDALAARARKEAALRSLWI